MPDGFRRVRFGTPLSPISQSHTHGNLRSPQHDKAHHCVNCHTFKSGVKPRSPTTDSWACLPDTGVAASTAAKTHTHTYAKAKKKRGRKRRPPSPLQRRRGSYNKYLQFMSLNQTWVAPVSERARACNPLSLPSIPTDRHPAGDTSSSNKPHLVVQDPSWW